jgi:hypothetical protein
MQTLRLYIYRPHEQMSYLSYLERDKESALADARNMAEAGTVWLRKPDPAYRPLAFSHVMRNHTYNGVR